MIHHFAHFIQDTLKPIILETDRILQQCTTLKVNGKEIEKWLQSAIDCWIVVELVKSITFVIVSGMFCWVVWLILK